MTNTISEERLRNTRAWAAARVGSLSGADVIVGAIDELIALREAFAARMAMVDTPVEPTGHPCHCEHDPRCDVHRDGSCNCHQLSEKQPWTAGDGPCDCAAREGKLWHAADCSSLKPPQPEPKAGLEDVPFLPISPETLKAYAKQLRERGVVYVKYQDGTATVLQHEDIYLPIGTQNRTEKP